jgi:hypothetical protein
MRSLVLAKPALHIDASNRIVDAMLDVPGIGHRGLLSIFMGITTGLCAAFRRRLRNLAALRNPQCLQAVETEQTDTH